MCLSWKTDDLDFCTVNSKTLTDTHQCCTSATAVTLTQRTHTHTKPDNTHTIDRRVVDHISAQYFSNSPWIFVEPWMKKIHLSSIADMINVIWIMAVYQFREYLHWNVIVLQGSKLKWSCSYIPEVSASKVHKEDCKKRKKEIFHCCHHFKSLEIVKNRNSNKRVCSYKHAVINKCIIIF